jgi:hypothetical protein
MENLDPQGIYFLAADKTDFDSLSCTDGGGLFLLFAGKGNPVISSKDAANRFPGFGFFDQAGEFQ